MLTLIPTLKVTENNKGDQHIKSSLLCLILRTWVRERGSEWERRAAQHRKERGVSHWVWKGEGTVGFWVFNLSIKKANNTLNRREKQARKGKRRWVQAWLYDYAEQEERTVTHVRVSSVQARPQPSHLWPHYRIFAFLEVQDLKTNPILFSGQGAHAQWGRESASISHTDSCWRTRKKPGFLTPRPETQ